MKIALAAEGSFFEDRSLGVELHWGRGGGERSVAEVPDDAAEANTNLAGALERGEVVILEGSPKAKKAAKPASAGPSFKELQAEAAGLGLKSIGVKRADLEAAIAAAKAVQA